MNEGLELRTTAPDTDWSLMPDEQTIKTFRRAFERWAKRRGVRMYQPRDVIGFEVAEAKWKREQKAKQTNITDEP